MAYACDMLLTTSGLECTSKLSAFPNQIKKMFGVKFGQETSVSCLTVFMIDPALKFANIHDAIYKNTFIKFDTHSSRC